MKNNNALISIIIPCYNEKEIIEKCLDSILMQDYQKDRMEILVVDGMSTDGTRKIITDYANKHASLRMLDNPKQIVPTAMNIGIKSCAGQIIIRMDAHAQYPQDYVRKCVQYLKEYNVDNIGGICLTLPGAETMVAKAIALAVTSSFGVGNSLFRIGVKKPTLVDTVPFGCYRREVFDKIGLFDEDLVRNQDTEFNLRLKKAGGKILLVPDIASYYYARDTYSKLLKMYLQYGYFRVLTLRKVGKVIGFRQLVPAIFVTSLMIWLLLSFFSEVFLFLFIAEFALYFIVNTFVSLSLAIKKKEILPFPLLIVAFLVSHFGFGFAYLGGVFDFFILKKNKVDRSRISLTR